MAYRSKATFLKTLVGDSKIEDALSRIEKLTQEEALTVAAQALDTALHVHDKVIHVASVVEDVDGKMKGIDGRVNGIDDRMKRFEENMNSIRDIFDSTWLNSMDQRFNRNILCRSHRSNGKFSNQYR